MTKVYFLFDIEGEYACVLSIDLDLEVLRTARDMCKAQDWSTIGLNLKDYKLWTFEQLGGVKEDGFMSAELVRQLSEEQYDEMSAEVPICLSQAGVEQLHVGANGSVTVELSNETNEFSESLDLDDLLAFKPAPARGEPPEREFTVRAVRNETQTRSVSVVVRARRRDEARKLAMTELSKPHPAFETNAIIGLDPRSWSITEVE